MSGASNDEEVFGKDLGLMHELAVTGRPIGFKAEDWGKLAHDRERLHQFLAVLRGEAKIVYEKIVVDTDADPTPRAGAVVCKHEKHGRLTFSAGDIKFLSVYPLLPDPDVMFLNANVLDRMLAHPLMIPDQWRYLQGGVCFVGTIFKAPEDDTDEEYCLVRFMVWDESLNHWRARYRSIESLRSVRHGRRPYLAVLEKSGT
jgi:hypothetical protein